MAKAGDFYVGSQLFCGAGENLGVPIPPVGLGVGPTKIRGAGYIAGPLIIGSPISYTSAPNVNEANLMIARLGNAEAVPPPPPPLAVMTPAVPIPGLGDPPNTESSPTDAGNASNGEVTG